MHVNLFFYTNKDGGHFVSKFLTENIVQSILLFYLMQDHQTSWCCSTSWHGAVLCIISRSLWVTLWKRPFCFQIFKRKCCPQHIFYTILCRITKLSVVVHQTMGQCLVSEIGHCDLRENIFHSISFMIFDVGSPNLVW